MLKHIAVIADGNRRWAKQRHLPTGLGYMQGLVTIENLCEWAIAANVPYLTVYCFSTENWKRPPVEVNMIMSIGRDYGLKKDWYVNRNIHVQFYGRTDRLEKDIVNTCREIEMATQHCDALNLTICLDYGGKNEIITAIQNGITTEEKMDEYMTRLFPNPDIILRTGGEYRLSNFLMWQSAYSELFFIDTLFPDLTDEIMNTIVTNFEKRKRNYGG